MTSLDIPTESNMPEDDPRSGGRKTKVVAGLIVGLLFAGGAGWWVFSSEGDADRLTPAVAPIDTPAASHAEEYAIGASQAVPIELVANFRVDIQVKPAHAQIFLDGNEVGRGRFQLELPRDGHVHEIRILAEGYAPERLVFADASPQREVVLAAEEEEDGEEAEPPTARRPLRATPPAGRAGARHEAAPVPREHKEEVRKETIGSSLPPENTKSEPAPSVRIIEDEGPNVRVVE